VKAWLRRGWPWLVVTFGFAVVAWVAVVDPSAAIENFSPAAPVDLLAFYCSARVAASGSDPYLAEPLRSCEHEEFRRSTGHVSRYPLLVIPAPLPPYALFLLKPLAALPFAVARACSIVAVTFSSFALTVLLFLLARTYRVVFIVGVLIGVLVPALELGQIAPLAIAALAASAWAVRTGRIRFAAVAAAFTLVEPHLGLPAVAALFLCAPRTRGWLAACGVGLGLASLACGGLDRNLEYLTRVIPAQAVGEGMSFGGQYSLAALAAEAGAPARIALLSGSLSYLFMLVVGVLTAQACCKRTGDASYAVAVAPAFTLLGGTYVHIHQMAAALPLAAILLGSTQRTIVPALALLGLLVPWDLIEKSGVLSAWFAAIPPHDAHAALAAVAGGDRLAEDVWGAWVRSDPNGNRPALELLLFKLPTWFSLIALCVLTLRTALSSPRSGTTVGYALTKPT
jgi:hypothetical protein